MDPRYLCVVIRKTDGCPYQLSSEACPYQINIKSTVDELKAHVCSFWQDISPELIQFVWDFEGRSNVVDSDAKLRSYMSLSILNQLSFLELRLFERVPIHAHDFVLEPTTSEFHSAPQPSRDQFVTPSHLPSNSRMSEFRSAPDPSIDPSHLPSSSRMSEVRSAPDPSRAQFVTRSSGVTRTPTMTEFLLSQSPIPLSQSPIPSSQDLVSSQDIVVSQELTYNGTLAFKRSCKAAEWEFLIKGVGQDFYGGRDEARLVVEKYNHFFSRRVRTVHSNPRRYTVECFYKEKLGCQWMFHAAPKFSNVKGHLFLKAYTGEHTCGAGYSDGTKPDPVTRDLIKSLICHQIVQNPNKNCRDIVRELKSDYGLDVSYDQAHAGRELCYKEMYGEDTKSYSDLDWWCDAVKKYDPGSVADLVVEGGEFKSLFLAFDACISGFEFCRPVLFLDATFLTGKFRGCLMAATGKNANNGIFPLAYGIVQSETVENWHWFLKKLETILGPRVLTIISDRHEGLIQGVRDVFPHFFHAWCYQHLKNNVRSKTNKRKAEHCAAMCLFKECFYSSTHEGFHQGMQKLLDMGCDGLHKFLSDLPVECWSNAHCLGCRYGDMCSNIAESFNAWIREAKGMPIATLVNWIRLKIMEQMSTRKKKGATYKGFLCPRLEKKVQASIRAGVQWRITKSGDMEWEVFDGKHAHAVNIARFQCSCRVWFTEQFPCDHAIACMHSSNINIYEYINPFFNIATFRASYDRSIKPIPDYDKPIDVATGKLVNPPTVLGKKPGRPKKKRIPNTGSAAAFKRPITCGNCHTKVGHNKTTCPYPPAKKQCRQ